MDRQRLRCGLKGGGGKEKGEGGKEEGGRRKEEESEAEGK